MKKGSDSIMLMSGEPLRKVSSVLRERTDFGYPAFDEDNQFLGYFDDNASFLPKNGLGFAYIRVYFLFFFVVLTKRQNNIKILFGCVCVCVFAFACLRV